MVFLSYRLPECLLVDGGFDHGENWGEKRAHRGPSGPRGAQRGPEGPRGAAEGAGRGREGQEGPRGASCPNLGPELPKRELSGVRFRAFPGRFRGVSGLSFPTWKMVLAVSESFQSSASEVALGPSCPLPAPSAAPLGPSGPLGAPRGPSGALGAPLGPSGPLWAPLGLSCPLRPLRLREGGAGGGRTRVQEAGVGEGRNGVKGGGWGKAGCRMG